VIHAGSRRSREPLSSIHDYPEASQDVFGIDPEAGVGEICGGAEATGDGRDGERHFND
jgi:hypothetical protein